MVYCKFRNFRENSIFAKMVKRHICDTQSSRLRHYLDISVNDRLILLFRIRSFAKIKPSPKFPNLQYELTDITAIREKLQLWEEKICLQCISTKTILSFQD